MELEDSDEATEQISLQVLHQFLVDVTNKLLQNDCYEHAANEICNFQRHLKIEICHKLADGINKFVSFKSSSVFMETYYGNIIQYGESFFKGDFSGSTIKIILIKLADLIFVKHQGKERKVVEENAHSINDRQLAGLQYLGGYVLHTIYKKIKNSKQFKNKLSQECLVILEAARETNEELFQNNKLVSALSRGGLWCITEKMQHVFVICEKYLLRKTGGIPSIPIKGIITDLLGLSVIGDLFDQITERLDPEISMNSKKSTLYAIIRLFIHVRMFSIVKDFNQKERLHKHQGKRTGLRKSLKEKSGI